jgi:hypothetical protein
VVERIQMCVWNTAKIRRVESIVAFKFSVVVSKFQQHSIRHCVACNEMHTRQRDGTSQMHRFSEQVETTQESYSVAARSFTRATDTESDQYGL